MRGPEARARPTVPAPNVREILVLQEPCLCLSPPVSCLLPTCLHSSWWHLCRNATWEYGPLGPPPLPVSHLSTLTYACFQPPETHCLRRLPDSTERDQPGLPRGPQSRYSQRGRPQETRGAQQRPIPQVQGPQRAWSAQNKVLAPWHLCLLSALSFCSLGLWRVDGLQLGVGGS